ncbi:MAG TPA: cytochrome c3 family protein [Kofleriaceae bacterium]|nr:cytochrome c3 family protein [Kofleriaceae bacterium]
MRARGAAVVIAAAAVLALALAVLVLAAPVARAEPAGFDHNIHRSRVSVTGAAEIPCASCHAWRANALAGKPGHAACFDRCHGGRPTPPARGGTQVLAPERARVCVACHDEAVLQRPYAGPAPYAVAYPPYRTYPDHALEIGHKTHSAIACTQCHDGTRGPPHRRCASCHDGAPAAGHGIAMTECARCHAPASGVPESTRLAMSSQIEILVTSAFSHQRHAARGGAGRQCTTCHAAIATTNERQLPRPAAKDCATAGCHDGAAAFPTTAACTRCHKDVPQGRFEVARPETRFSHATHRPKQLPCASCHPLGKSGEVVVAGHAACAPCHAEDFGKRRPAICGACHNATEPWRQLVPDRLPAERTEFGATIDHGKHPGACAACHALTTAAAQLRPPRGHRSCLGAGCHAVSGGPAPAMTACEACHQEGRAEARLRARLAAPWSVRAAFDHATHRRGKDGALTCTACHTDLTAPDLATLRTPAKATCAGCHDGAAAFKLTGTTCTRCHGGARAGRGGA